MRCPFCRCSLTPAGFREPCRNYLPLPPPLPVVAPPLVFASEVPARSPLTVLFDPGTTVVPVDPGVVGLTGEPAFVSEPVAAPDCVLVPPALVPVAVWANAPALGAANRMAARKRARVFIVVASHPHDSCGLRTCG
jgi:hypothetical protein